MEEQAKHWLLSNGFESSDQIDEQGSPVLHYAIGVHAQSSIISWLLAHHPNAIHTTDNSGVNAIHVAAAYGNVAALELLVPPLPPGLSFSNDRQHLLCRQTHDGITPLLMSIEKNHLQVARYLHSLGAPTSGSVGLHGDFPLWTASFHGYVDIVRWLLADDGGARDDVHSSTERGDTALMAACQSGELECIQLLWESGSDLRAVNHRGITPLWLACQHGNVDIVRWLCEAGHVVGVRRDIEKVADDGSTCMTIACTKGWLDIAKLCHRELEELQSECNPREMSLCLYGAARGGFVDILEWMLEIEKRSRSKSRRSKSKSKSRSKSRSRSRSRSDTDALDWLPACLETSLLLLCRHCPKNTLACVKLLCSKLKQPVALRTKDKMKQPVALRTKDKMKQEEATIHTAMLQSCLQSYKNDENEENDKNDDDDVHRLALVKWLLVTSEPSKHLWRPSTACKIMSCVPSRDQMKLALFAQSQLDCFGSYVEFCLCVRSASWKLRGDSFLEMLILTYLIPSAAIGSRRNSFLQTMKCVVDYKTLTDRGHFVCSAVELRRLMVAVGEGGEVKNNHLGNTMAMLSSSSSSDPLYAFDPLSSSSSSSTSVFSTLRSWCVSDVKERLTASFTHSHQLELLPLLLNDASTLERAFHDVCVAYRLGEDYDEMRRQGGTWWDWLLEMFSCDLPVFEVFVRDQAKITIDMLFDEGGMQVLCEYLRKRGKVIWIVQESGRVQELVQELDVSLLRKLRRTSKIICCC